MSSYFEISVKHVMRKQVIKNMLIDRLVDDDLLDDCTGKKSWFRWWFGQCCCQIKQLEIQKEINRRNWSHWACNNILVKVMQQQRISPDMIRLKLKASEPSWAFWYNNGARTLSLQIKIVCITNICTESAVHPETHLPH